MAALSILARTRKAIFDVFGDYIADNPKDAAKIIRESTYTGKEDPGGWAPGAAVVISLEGGLPSGSYNIHVLEKWIQVSDRLGDYHVEEINGGVAAVYRD